MCMYDVFMSKLLDFLLFLFAVYARYSYTVACKVTLLPGIVQSSTFNVI